MRNPCKRDCPDRSATCHAECVKYLNYYEWCKEARKRDRQRGNIDGYVKDAVLASKRSSRNWRV